jgi:putative PIN family toxin of toxin-antitoxin system
VPLRVVFDTNVLFSWVGWRGPPFQCVELARRGVVEGATCAEIMKEFAEKLELKLAFSREDADGAVADALGFLRLVRIPGLLHAVTRDPDDDKVLECALLAKAGYLVSGDKDLLVLREFRGVKIVKAAEFLKILAE